jgi:ribulose-phosphate 3-epimerase
MIHLDVMDGHFVPNLSMGPDLIRSLRPITALPFDVHCMMKPVQPFLETFANAGADLITIHPEAEENVEIPLREIRRLGKKAGLALSPGTPETVLEPFLDLIDLVVVMTIVPGFAGQEFLPFQLEKIERVKNMIDRTNRDILLSVDGGITDKTALKACQAGARMLVSSSFIVREKGKYAEKIALLKGATRKIS